MRAFKETLRSLTSVRPARRIFGSPPIRSRLSAGRTQFHDWNSVRARGSPDRIVAGPPPALGLRHPAARGHHGARADPKDPHPFRRTTRTAADLARTRPAHRLGRARLGPRRPRHLSGVPPRAARDRHPQPLTHCGREASTKRPGVRTRRDSAPTAEKCHSRGEGSRYRCR